MGPLLITVLRMLADRAGDHTIHAVIDELEKKFPAGPVPSEAPSEAPTEGTNP